MKVIERPKGSTMPLGSSQKPVENRGDHSRVVADTPFTPTYSLCGSTESHAIAAFVAIGPSWDRRHMARRTESNRCVTLGTRASVWRKGSLTIRTHQTGNGILVGVALLPWWCRKHSPASLTSDVRSVHTQSLRCVTARAKVPLYCHLPKARKVPPTLPILLDCGFALRFKGVSRGRKRLRFRGRKCGELIATVSADLRLAADKFRTVGALLHFVGSGSRGAWVGTRHCWCGDSSDFRDCCLDFP